LKGFYLFTGEILGDQKGALGNIFRWKPEGALKGPSYKGSFGAE